MIQTLRSRRAILATASLVSTLTDTLGGPLLVSGGGTVDATTVPAVLTRDGATNVVSSYANWMSRHLDLKASPYTCTSYGRFR